MISYVPDTPDITIPAELLPSDGRFGSGPSKVRPEQIAALAEVATTYLGTSHRQKTVKSQVGPGPRRVPGAVLPPRRLRGRARQRRDHLLLGRRHLRADRRRRAST